MEKLELAINLIKNRRSGSGPDYRDAVAILLFIFLLPYIISFFFGSVGMEIEEGEAAVIGKEERGEKDGSGRQELFWEDMEKAEFIVCNKTTAGTEMMPLETYLVNRLPSTIPMEYEMEALKAQTIVLRTELMRLYYDNREERNEGKDGKKYIYVESDMIKSAGAAYQKCIDAVSSTKGMYLTYEGYPVTAPYFAVSAGATRNGNEVFGSNDYGYLKSVVCGRDFTSGDYVHSERMGKGVFLEQLREFRPGVEWEEGETPEEAFPVRKDKAGYVLEIGTGENAMSGELFRTIFALNSSCFELREEGGSVIIKTKGVGHGLGLCQYSANEAAKKGSDFIDILNYFFSEIVIEKTE